MRKTVRLLVLNGVIIIAAVIGYSPGLLALRPSDPFFRAGLSIILGIVLAAGFLLGNLFLLSDNKPGWIQPEERLSLADAKFILKQRSNGKVFGNLAKTAYSQAERLERVSERAEQIMESRFGKGTMSAGRYISAVKAARESLAANCIRMANRFAVFDETEYEKLRHYKEDDIPDEIQEKQIALYRENEEKIRDAIAANERLLVEMETLSLELAGGEQGDKPDGILAEIRKLTDEVKLYQS